MAFLRSESVSEGVKNLVFPGIEGGGGRGGGGGGWTPGDRGDAEGKLEGRRYYIIFRNKNTSVFFWPRCPISFCPLIV